MAGKPAVESEILSSGKEVRKKKFPFRAFTLVELIVVITILAILATVGFLTLSGYTDDARSATVAANVRTVYSAILTESTTSGNSPRYYVDHDPAAALSGGIVFVDGNPVALTGGQWGSGGTNYSAGNPRWDRLKMNGDKFRLSAVFRGMLGTAGFADPVRAAYDTGAISVGAFDYVGKAGVSGKARTAAYFQVAGISPGTKKASVTGNYTAAGTGAVAGLVRDPGSSSSTGSIVESATVSFSAPPSLDSECQTAPVNHTQTASCGTYYDTVSLWNSKPIWWAICQDETSRGWTIIKYKKISNAALVTGTSASTYMEVYYLNASGTWVNMTPSVTTVQTEYPQFYTNKNFGYTHMGHPCCQLGIIGTSGTEVASENCTLWGNKFRWQ